MVSSHSSTELQLLKSGIALSISGGLFKLRPRERQMAIERQREREWGEDEWTDKKISWTKSENKKRVKKWARGRATGGKGRFEMC